MSARKAHAQKNVYRSSPSIQEMKQQRKFRKTLRFYQGVIQEGMMILPDDIEGFPAPVLCSFCEVPVITRPKNEKSGIQKYELHRRALAFGLDESGGADVERDRFGIGWASFISAGLLFFPVFFSMLITLAGTCCITYVESFITDRETKALKDIVHECPACEAAIATYAQVPLGYVTKVHRSYKDPVAGSAQQRGHAADNWQVGGYATVQIGDRYLIKGVEDT